MSLFVLSCDGEGKDRLVGDCWTYCYEVAPGRSTTRIETPVLDSHERLIDTSALDYVFRSLLKRMESSVLPDGS